MLNWDSGYRDVHCTILSPFLFEYFLIKCWRLDEIYKNNKDGTFPIYSHSLTLPVGLFLVPRIRDPPSQDTSRKYIWGYRWTEYKVGIQHSWVLKLLWELLACWLSEGPPNSSLWVSTSLSASTQPLSSLPTNLLYYLQFQLTTSRKVTYVFSLWFINLIPRNLSQGHVGKNTTWYLYKAIHCSTIYTSFLQKGTD